MVAWLQILIYLISLIFVGIILVAVDWTKVIRKTHKSFGIALYIIVTLALGYGLGSLFIKLITEATNIA